MSLINEALKRARQTPSHPPVTAARDPALQPVLQQPVASPLAPYMPMAAGIVLALGIACLLWWWLRSPAQRPVTPAHQTQPVSVRPRQIVASTTPLAPAHPTNAVTSAPILQPSRPHPTSVPAPGPAPDATVVQETSVAKRISEPAAPVAEPTTSLTGAKGTATTAPAELTEIRSEPAKFDLQGIFYRLRRASALINGRTVFVGDEIEGAKVVAIERYCVRLKRGREPFELKLN